MVVYAQDQVTLQVLESFTGAYTYYRAMPAGSSAPPAPTTETPDPAQWSSTEPAFNPGTTTVLYTVTKNTTQAVFNLAADFDNKIIDNHRVFKISFA